MDMNTPPSRERKIPPVRGPFEDRTPPGPSPTQRVSPFSPSCGSSPQKPFNRGPMRYYNAGNSSHSTPYKRHNNRGNFHRGGRNSGSSPNISAYWDPSALENPWADLEREYEQRKLESKSAKSETKVQVETSTP